MPRFTVRMDDPQRERLREAGQRTGLSDSDIVRMATGRFLDEIEEEVQPGDGPVYVPPSSSEHLRILKLAARFQSRWPLLSASMGAELAEREMVRDLSSRIMDQQVALREIPVGEIVVRGGKPYILAAKNVPGERDPVSGAVPICYRLRPLDGGKSITIGPPSDGDGYVDATIKILSEVVIVPHRLSTLRPPAYLTLVDFEKRAVLALADGPQSLEGLYQKIHVRPGFSMANRRVTRSELGTLAGQLLVSLGANALATFGDNPLVGPWLLTSRGEEVAKMIGGNTHED